MLHQSDEVYDTNFEDLAQMDGPINHRTNVENQCQMDGVPSYDSMNETIGRHIGHTRVGVEENVGDEAMKATTIVEEELEGRFGHNAFEEAYRVPLYKGSTLSKLCATLLILNCCCTHGTSNAFITKLLGLLKKNILPMPNTLPSSKYEVSNTLKKLGLTYDVIDVCVNGCMLFQGEHVNTYVCRKCGEPRYK
jgi:hypothetical protein